MLSAVRQKEEVVMKRIFDKHSRKKELQTTALRRKDLGWRWSLGDMVLAQNG